MDWTGFDPRSEDKSAAFEALAGQLFERFCRREHCAALRAIRFANGRGGDGGVEAYAVLWSGEEVGLQAKWFREAFGPKQIAQIEGSLRAAIENHPRLFRYIIAIPRKLTADRGKRSGGASTKRRPETSEWKHWENWCQARAREIAPGTEIVLWDDAALLGLLSQRENEGLHAYWFTNSVITLDDLNKRFAHSKRGWLLPRYFPHLHAVASLEHDLTLRLGTRAPRAELLRQVLASVGELSGIREDVARLGHYASFMRGVEDASSVRDAALAALKKVLTSGETLADALRTGAPLRGKPDFGPHEEDALRRLDDALHRLEEGRGMRGPPTEETSERLRRSLWENQAPLPILRIWKRWTHAADLVAFVGPPGVGKTHGLVHAVEQHLDDQQPALLLRARDCRLGEDGWAGILRPALDRPTWSFDALLDALEALALRAEVWRAGEGAARFQSAEEGEVMAAPTCFLLAIDGLEESGNHARWAELLSEMVERLKHHPRLRVAVTLRTTSREAIVGWTKPGDISQVQLLADVAHVQDLLGSYCTANGVPVPDRRLRWAIRDPLSVRLYCQLSQDDKRWGLLRHELSLPSLLKRKIAHAEEAMRGEGGWSPHEHPLHTALAVVASAYVRHGRVTREDAIEMASAAQRPVGLLTSAAWSWLFDRAAEHGLILVQTNDDEQLRQAPISYVEPAYDPLTDYLIAETASDEVHEALSHGARPLLGELLKMRPDALTQAATLLAQRGVDIIACGLWTTDFPADRLEELQLRAIAALDNEASQPYAGWVRDRLVASMPSCRRVLTELCVAVARDENHPLGPRFVHEVLLPYLPAKRDLFWSGPSYLPGDGTLPWEGHGPEALEHLVLEPDDRADGPPLLLAWALTSVDTRWRRLNRANLARWGSQRLDELVRWLGLAVMTNDPQMAEDVAMVAFGAACLAGEDPKLGALAAWVDANLLAPDACHRREDIVVIHAARGIVERARIMGADIDPAALGHTKVLYSNEPDTLPIDSAAARGADDHYGASPVTGDLAWYVVPGAIRDFFSVDFPHRQRRIDPRAEYVLTSHAAMTGTNKLTPQKFAFGVVTAHLYAMGWNKEEFVGEPRGGAPGEVLGMDLAILRNYAQATHGSRSPICKVAEKYVWTGCYMLQAYLAGRVPADTGFEPDRWIEPPVDPVLVAHLSPNPASDVDRADAISVLTPWHFWADDDLAQRAPLVSMDQHDRAIEWVRTAPLPELRPWMRLPQSACPPWASNDEWITLRCFVVAREKESQAESLLRISSAFASDRRAPQIMRRTMDSPRLNRRELYEFTEGVRGHVYVDPVEAVWAPWATGVGGFECIESPRPSSSDGAHFITATVASFTWEAGAGEQSLWLPAHWLRRELEIMDVKCIRSATHKEWRYVDRQGYVHAVYTITSRGSEHREALIIRHSSLKRVCGETAQRLVWGGWLFRELSTSLGLSLPEERGYVRRNWKWIGIMTRDDVDVVHLPGWGAIEGTAKPVGTETTAPEERPEERPAPLVPTGPTNPSRATKLALNLDDESAVPYFLWDDPMTVGELRRYLAAASPPERDRMLGKVLREARDPDVWRFTSPDEVASRFDVLSRHLGRRRAFWKFLLESWEREGLLARKSA